MKFPQWRRREEELEEEIQSHLRMAIRDRMQRGESAKAAKQASICKPQGTRKAYFGGWRDIPVYAFDTLQPGHSLNGPAIIEAETTTVLVDTGDRVSVNALGWLDIALR